MVTRAYRCRQCGWETEVRVAITAPHLRVCGYCRAPSLAQCYAAAPVVLFRGGRPSRSVAAGRVDGDRRLRRELVLRNSDGSESVYGSVEQARRDELERHEHEGWYGRRLMAANLRQLTKLGYVPGTPPAALAQAIEDAPQR